MVYRVTTEYFEEDPKLIEEFTLAARDVWADYVWRNRNYIVSSLSSLGDMDTALNWVIQNNEDVSALIAKYYGDDNGKKVMDLLSEMSTTTSSLMVYLKKPPANFRWETDEYLKSLLGKWQEKTDQLVLLLNVLNPLQWPRDTLQNIFNDLRRLWILQITSRQSSNWTEDLTALDRTFDLIRSFASVFTGGVVQQNPERFARV